MTTADFRCAHRWAFPKWGEALELQEDQLAAPVGREVTVKYIDPSYAIRSVPACPSDSIYCWNMARNAVHAAMAGNTGMLIGRWHGRFVHVPISVAIRSKRHVDPDGDLWMSVIEATGQPRTLV